MIRHLVGGLAVVFLAAACLPTVQTGPGNGGETVVEETEIHQPEGEDSCGAARLQHLVGMDWPQPLPEGTMVRAIPHGVPATADFFAERVNIELAPDGRRIQRIWCG